MTLHRKLLRSTKKNLSFYITATILTALTIMLWVGAFSVADTMTDTYNKTFNDSKLEDALFTVSEEISTADIPMLERNYSVTIEKQNYKNTILNDKRLRIFADTEKLNLIQVIEGSKISDNSDILITYNYAKANNIAIGDNLELYGHSFSVCGYALKPDYAAMFAEFTDTFPDGKNFGIAIISRDAMDSLGSYSSYYSVKYSDTNKESSFREYIYKTHGTLQYIDKKDNPRTGALISSATDIKSEFSVYSPILLFVVAVVIAMVLSRTVKREYKSIGTLTALGYTKSELTKHYIMYALIPSITGDILGAIGCIPFSKLFCIYMFSFSEYINYSPKLPVLIFILALLIPPIVYCSTALIVISKCLETDVVVLLKGQRNGKISHAMREKNMPFKWLYNIRTVLANKGRSLTLLIGIAVATMAVMVGGLYQHAYDDFLDNKVPKAMLGGQYEYGFIDFQSENPYGGNAIFDVSFGVKGTDSLFNLIGYDESSNLIETTTVSGDPVSYGGYYMTSAAAKLFGIKKGDSFSFYNLLSMEKSTIVITDIIENDVLSLVLTSKENVAEILHRNRNEYDVIISTSPLNIPEELLNKSASLEDYRSSSENTFRTAKIVLYIVNTIGSLICILVVVMLAGMIVDENRRNISLLEVLGYKKNEMRSLILSSNHLIVPIGFLIGIPLGIALSEMIAATNAASSGMFMTIELTMRTLFTGILFVGAAYIISLLLASRKLRKVDMVECLKEDRE